MRTTEHRSPEAALPKELQSSLRQVALSGSGVVVAVLVVAALLAAVCLPVLLYGRLRQAERLSDAFASASAATRAELGDVVRPRDKKNRVRITYRYVVAGKQYTGQARLRRGEADGLAAGSQIRVRYLVNEPGQSWLHGQRPRFTPVWVVFLLPPALVPPAGLLVMVIRRQTRLLRDGRAVLATVTNARKLRGREATTWRVHYEWTLLSGARRSGRHDMQTKTPPAVGATLPILYDRDNPQRHARYPLSLVRIPGSSDRRGRVMRWTRPLRVW